MLKPAYLLPARAVHSLARPSAFRPKGRCDALRGSEDPDFRSCPDSPGAFQLCESSRVQVVNRRALKGSKHHRKPGVSHHVVKRDLCGRGVYHDHIARLQDRIFSGPRANCVEIKYSRRAHASLIASEHNNVARAYVSVDASGNSHHVKQRSLLSKWIDARFVSCRTFYRHPLTVVFCDSHTHLRVFQVAPTESRGEVTFQVLCGPSGSFYLADQR